MNRWELITGFTGAAFAFALGYLIADSLNSTTLASLTVGFVVSTWWWLLLTQLGLRKVRRINARLEALNQKERNP